MAIPLERQETTSQRRHWVGIPRERGREAGHEVHGEESKKVMYRKVERHGQMSRSWPRIERDGKCLWVAYTLAQGREGWKVFVGGLYPGPG